MIAARVMIVEDERIVALHLKQQLTRLGYQVPSTATSGERALEQITAVRPDVVLMDIHIEGSIDGIATAGQIPAELQIPVIYLSAYSEEATLDRARGTRPYGYLIKPFSERELHASIQMVLERRRADTVLEASERRLDDLVNARTSELVAANVRLEEETAHRLKVERELHEVQKMEAIGQLTGGIAHDFNNLLMVIMGHLASIQRRDDLPVEAIRRSAATALRACEKAAMLTHRLLSYSRRQPLDPKPLNPNHLVALMSDTLQRTLGEGVAIETTLAADIGWVSVDGNQLESALLNIALNSRDALGANGKLTIETGNAWLDAAYCERQKEVTPGEYVVIAVSDTGAGMSKEIVAQAFEPFFTTKDVGRGTGLGLSQVFGFIKQSGGHVTLYSEVGSGTTIKLYLPRLAGIHYTDSTPVSAPSSVPTGVPSEWILVVEDDEDVRANAMRQLGELGYSVMDAADAPTALRLLEQHAEIGLLFTDVGLPGMNGRQLADEARRLRPELRVLFTTAYARNAIVHQGRLDPGVDLITKPCTFAALATKVRDALDK
jgi:signal transduction histidine kinase